jgi:hypothetical protein
MRKITPQISSFAKGLTKVFILAIILFVSTAAHAQLTVKEGTATQGYTLNAAAFAVDPALTVTSGSNISGFRVTISTGLQSGDVLSYTGTLPSGISVTAYNSSTGTLAFTGSTSAANWQTFLRTVTYRCTNTSQVGDRTVTFSAGSSSAFTNGHYYELISSTSTWTSAKTAAEARSYLGYGGYLATITSAAENNFIRQVLNADAWIGASDNYTYINAATGTTTFSNQSNSEGKWYWVTGPEAGTQFSTGNNFPTAVSGRYTNWNSGEPNNSGGEHYGEIYSSGSNPGAWNDLPNNSLAYVVEYGGLATDPVQTISANVTIYMHVTSNTISSAQTICNGASASTITGTSVGGGTGSYTYQWQSSTTSATSGFSAATGTNSNTNYSPSTPSVSTWYRRIATSGFASDTTAALKITVNPAITSSGSSTSVSCYSGSNGTASLSVSGGTAPYTYSWSPTGGTNAFASGLSAGTYTVNILDNVGCSSSRSITVTQPAAALSNSWSQTNVACNATTTGTATVIVSGGTSPYTYSWTTGATSNSISSLAAGAYTCTITDANSCTSARSFTITQPTAITTTPTSTNVACNGLSTGAASISTSGGTPAYMYQWSNGGFTSSKTGLAAGTYTVTVTDANNCSSSRTFTITQPTAVATSASTTNVSCNGGTNGSATISPSGGTSPYTYLWSSGGTTANKSSLSAGTYTCTITDNNGCTALQSATITQPSGFSLGGSTTNVSCNGGSNGSATIIVSGATSPYSYSWPSGGTSATSPAYIAGSYTCDVTDANGCTTSRSFTISQPTAISINGTAHDAGCNGASTGNVTTGISGGTTPYTYTWSNGSTSGSATQLAAGTYTLTLTDANGCTSQRSYTVNQPSAITSNASSTDALCNGSNDGTAEVSPTGGTSPYTITWQGGGTGTTITALAAGNYTYSIIDANGCLKTGSTTIGQPTALSTNLASTNISCFGGNNGTLAATPAGGTAPYQYTWNHTADVTSSLNNQTAGLYTCNITDANGCTSTESITITQPTVLSTTTSQTNITCNGGNNGIAEIMPMGGTTPYAYAWDHSTDNVSSFNDLTFGTYQCTITDGNGCETTASFIITEPSAISASNNVIEPLCNGGTAEATVTATGGTGNLSYNWSNGTNTASDNNLLAGTYSVVITDDNGCSYSTSITVNEPTAVQMTITTTNPLCNSGDGSASVTAIGGTGAYSYDWSTGSTTDSETAIYAGQYSLTITDDNGCAYTQNFTITDPVAISTSFTTVAPLCNGGTGEATIQATGGTGNLNIQWSSGGTSTTESNLTAGTYQVQVMDANGCLNNSSVTITEPTAISYNVTVVDEHCNQNNGSISVTANGGTGVLSYNWNNGSSDASISSLAAGTFDFTIYDENGCTIMNQAAVNNIAAPTASAITSNVLCNGDQNGTIDLTVNGGSSNYSYTWSNGEITEDLIALAAGTYDYTVTDDANCSTTGRVTISEPTSLTATFVSTNETTGNDGSIDLTVNGGTPAYTYSWDNGSTTEDLSGLTAGTYVVVITDGNGCNTSTTVDITSTVGIFNPNNDIQAINISPNPSNGTIVIKGLPYGEYAIYDAAGRLIKSFTANETQIKLNLDALSNGLYSIRNLSGIETRAGRFIISK